MSYQAKMSKLSVAMVQMEIANDPMKNTIRYLSEAKKAVEQSADIVIGSEMMLSPYISGDRYENEAFVAEMVTTAEYIVRESASINGVLIFGGIGIDEQYTKGADGRRRKYNAAFVAQNGKQIHNDAGLPFAIKTLLPNYRIYDDSRHFYSLRQLAEVRDVPVEEFLKPFTVIIKGVEYKLGIMLCEDMWDIDYSIKPARILKDNSAEILINLSASNWSWRKNQKRDQVISNLLKDLNLWFVYVNNVGCQNNGKNFIPYDGASTVYQPDGQIKAMCERYQEETLAVNLVSELVQPVRPEVADITELYKAIEVATKGYLQSLPELVKRKVVIGVSGGIDSALSVAFFAKLLGPENVIAVNMPYRAFNSKETKNDAEELCRRLNVSYQVVSIDRLVDESCVGTGIEPDTTRHKPVQTVARMYKLSNIALQRDAIFVSNAVMPELAFGYGSLNADLRGFFAPWMNCLKQDVYRLADYMNREIYGREVIPQSIITRPPMDELTEQGKGERRDPFDYGNLVHKGYHDQMVRAIVAFRRSPEWFAEKYLDGSLESELQLPEGKLNALFKDREEWLNDLERCFKLFHNAIYKRVQSVPGPLIDKRGFGWDFRESILEPIETQRYKALVKQLAGAGYPKYQAK